MKTLNKTLCLVLALVMVLGLFGVASAAEYTDAADIQYEEAVDAMTGFGAINGYEDGSFKATGKVTRAEAAKMVAYAVLGKDIAEKLATETSSFSDVTADNWASPSIEYLVSKGVINGRGNGIYDPLGEVTSYEIAKMMLCAAGRGADGEYTGAQWQLNVAIDAVKYGIFDNTKEIKFDDAATREEAALYTFNGLTNAKNAVVAYNKTTEVYEQQKLNENIYTLAQAVYGAKTIEGVIVANQATGSKCTTIQTGFTAASTEPAVEAAYVTSSYNLTTGLDMIGHYVKIYYKTPWTAETSATTKGVAYSVVDESTVVTVEKAIAANETALKKAFGTTLPTVNTAFANTFEDYELPAADDAKANTIAYDKTTFNAAAGQYIIYKGAVYSHIVPATYTVAYVADVKAATATATGKIDFNGATDVVIPKTGDTDTTKDPAKTYATYSIYDGIAKGDVAIISSTGALTTVVKATTATGEVTAKSTTTGKLSVTAGSTYAAATTFAALGGLTDFVAFDNITLGEEYTFYLGTDGKLVAAAPVDDSSAVGLAYAVKAYTELASNSYGTATYLNKVQCVDMTGKEVVYTAGISTAANGNAVAEGNGATFDTLDALCTTYADEEPYEMTAAGTLVAVTTETNSTYKMDIATLTAASALPTDSTTTNAAKSSTAVAATSKVIAANNYYAADTQFIYVNGAGATMKVATATGAQAIASGNFYTYYSTKAADDTNYTVKYVVVVGTPAPSQSTSLMFVPMPFNTNSAVKYTEDGTTKTAYKNIAAIDGTPKTDVLVTAAEAVTIAAPGFYTFTVDSATGLYDLTSADISGTTTGCGKITNVYNGLLSVSNVPIPNMDTPKETNPYYGLHVAHGVGITDADASSAKIVDVPYLADQLLYDGAKEYTQITSLNDMLAEYSNAFIFYHFTVNAATGAETVDTIYIMVPPIESAT